MPGLPNPFSVAKGLVDGAKGLVAGKKTDKSRGASTVEAQAASAGGLASGPVPAPSTETTTEELDEEAARNESLLPWTIEQKVAMCLNPIKVPIVVLVLLFGCSVENRINWTTQESWRAKWWDRAGPVCYVHRLNHGLNKNFTFKLPDQLAAPLNNTINNIVTNLGANGSLTFNQTWFVIEKDVCGITIPTKGLDDEGCSVGPEEAFHHSEDGTDGLNGFKLPFVYYTLVWAVYKLVFMPIHWPDRLARRFTGNQYGEPMFKIMTQPHYRWCTGPMEIISKIGALFRYNMLPNSMLVPLATLNHVNGCEEYYYYRMDHLLAKVIYWWCIIDFMTVLGAVAFGHTIYSGKCIGSCLYKLYRFQWLLSLPIAFFLWLWDLINVFEWRFWKGIMLALDVVIDCQFDFTFTFVVDVAEMLACVVVFLDTLTLIIMILSLVCPKLGLRLPIVGEFLRQDMEEASAATKQETKPLVKR
jgi:hypothetical protein